MSAKAELTLAREANKLRNRKRRVKKMVKKIEGVETVVAAEKLNRRQMRTARKVGFANVRGRNYVIGKNNIADPRNLVNTLGRTAHGRTWALHALHPCGEDIPGQVQGIPDRVAIPVTCPEGRFFDNVKMPKLPDIVTKGDKSITIDSPWLKDSQQLWSVQMLVIPSAVGRIILQASPDGVFVPQGFVKANGDTNVPSSTWSRIPTQIPTLITQVLPPGFWNAVCCLEVPVLPTVNTTGDYKAWDLYNKFRVTFMGITCHLDVATLQNQGHIVAGQIGSDYKLFDANATWVSAVAASKSVYNISVPITDTDLTQQDPLVYNEVAKHGVYMPLRITEPVVNMADTASDPISLIFNNVNNEQTETDYTGVNPTYWTDQVDPSWSIGIVFFLSISNEATIDIKTRMGFECAVSARSVWRPFSKRPPLLDQAAIDAVSMLTQTMPHAFEAKFNDLGLIIDEIGKGIENLGIPIVSDIAKAARPIVRGVSHVIKSILG